MKQLDSFKDLKLGQKVAWQFNNIFDGQKEKDVWCCIGQVKGFHKITKYPNSRNGMVYHTTDMVTFGVVAIIKNEDTHTSVKFLLGANFNNEIVSPYKYDRRYFKIWLLEDEKDYLFVLKHIMVDNL